MGWGWGRMGPGRDGAKGECGQGRMELQEDGVGIGWGQSGMGLGWEWIGMVPCKDAAWVGWD